jgi:hypothetical protein
MAVSANRGPRLRPAVLSFSRVHPNAPPPYGNLVPVCCPSQRPLWPVGELGPGRGWSFLGARFAPLVELEEVRG